MERVENAITAESKIVFVLFFQSACPAIRLFFENFPITIVRR